MNLSGMTASVCVSYRMIHSVCGCVRQTRLRGEAMHINYREGLHKCLYAIPRCMHKPQ